MPADEPAHAQRLAGNVWAVEWERRVTSWRMRLQAEEKYHKEEPNKQAEEQQRALATTFVRYVGSSSKHERMRRWDVMCEGLFRKAATQDSGTVDRVISQLEEEKEKELKSQESMAKRHKSERRMKRRRLH